MSPEANFDFQSFSQEEEKLDYKHLKPCPNCKKPIASDATICYFCGQDVVYHTKGSWLSWLIAAGLVIILILVFTLSLR